MDRKEWLVEYKKEEYRKILNSPNPSKEDLVLIVEIFPSFRNEAWGIFLSLNPNEEDFIEVASKVRVFRMKIVKERLLSKNDLSNDQTTSIIRKLDGLHDDEHLSSQEKESIDPLIEKFYGKLKDPDYECLAKLSEDIPFLRKRIWHKVTKEKGLNVWVIKNFASHYKNNPFFKVVDISLIKEYISDNKDSLSKEAFPYIYIHLCFGENHDEETKEFFEDSLFDISLKNISSVSEFEKIIGFMVTAGGETTCGRRDNLCSTHARHLLDIFLKKKLELLNQALVESKKVEVSEEAVISDPQENSPGFLRGLWQKTKEENKKDFNLEQEEVKINPLENFFSLMKKLGVHPNELLASANKLDISSDIRKEILLRYEDKIRFKNFPLFGEDSIFRGLENRETREKEKAQEKINNLLSIDYSRTQSFKPDLSGAVGVELSSSPSTITYEAVEPDDVRKVMRFVSGCVDNNVELDNYATIIKFMAELVSNIDHYYSAGYRGSFQNWLKDLKEEIQKRELY